MTPWFRIHLEISIVYICKSSREFSLIENHLARKVSKYARLCPICGVTFIEMRSIPTPLVLTHEDQPMNCELELARVSEFVMPIGHGDFCLGGDDGVSGSECLLSLATQIFTGG